MVIDGIFSKFRNLLDFAKKKLTNTRSLGCGAKAMTGKNEESPWIE